MTPAHDALEKLRLWLEDARENHPSFAGETGLFLLMLERFRADHYPPGAAPLPRGMEVSDAMVERACQADYEYDNGDRIQRHWATAALQSPLMAKYYRARTRAGLEAALNPREEEA